MKRFAILATVAIVLLGFGVQAEASIAARESFNYDIGPLNGAGTVGAGWTSSWSAKTTATVVDPVTNLVVPYIDGGDRALQLTGNNDDIAYRTFAGQSGSEVFISFLFRFDAGALNEKNDFLTLWVDNSTTGAGNHGDVPNFGLKSNEGPGQEDYFVRFGVGNEAWSAHQAVVGETVQLVARLFKDGASFFNKFDLWVNPGYSDLSAPDAIGVYHSGLQQLPTVSRLGFRTANLDSNDVLLIDELTVATQWGEVVVPEPAAILVWTLLGASSWLGIGVCRRARRIGRRSWPEENRASILDIIERGRPR